MSRVGEDAADPTSRHSPPRLADACREGHDEVVDDLWGPGTALVVVDMQNDFALASGGLHVHGGEEIVPAVDAMIAAAVTAGSPVFYTQDWHPPVTPHFAKDGGVWPVHCVAGTWGAELVDGMRVAGPVVRKGVDGGDGYSGFSVRDVGSGEVHPTRLGSLLDAAGARRIVVTGLAGDVCVMHTALDGRAAGYDVVVPLPATRFVELAAGDGDRAVQRMREAGVSVVD